jgi:hypothetical protein
MEQSITVDTTNVNPPTPQPPSPLMTSLLAVLESHISDLVIQQVSRILVNHTTMKMIDEGFRQQVKEIATAVVEGAINNHVDEMYHYDDDEIADKATDAVNDFDFDDKINDAVSSALDQYDFNDIIRTEIKDNISFTISVD